MNDLLEFWGEWLPNLLDGLRISVEVTGACLALGIPLGLILALGVQSKYAAVACDLAGRRRDRPRRAGADPAAIHLFRIARAPASPCPRSPRRRLRSPGARALTRARSSAPDSRRCRTGRRKPPPRLASAGIDTLRYVILPQGLRVSVAAAVRLRDSDAAGLVALLRDRAAGTGEPSLCHRLQHLPLYVDSVVWPGCSTRLICIPATIAVSALERRLGRHVSLNFVRPAWCGT